jgi:hypothetical protein
MGCTGASIAMYAQHLPLHGTLEGTSNLASLGWFTAIAVLIGTLVLQLVHHFLSRRRGQASSSHRAKPLVPHKLGASHTGRRNKAITGAQPRSARVRFSGRS